MDRSFASACSIRRRRRLSRRAADALAVTLHETGLVDLDRIAELLGRSRETAIAELGDRIFLDPQATVAMSSEIWVTADAYLSGLSAPSSPPPVAAAALDPRYQRNVEALEKIQPEDLKPSDITARLGAPWIPAEVVAAFADEVLGVKTPVYHTVEIASWTINVQAFAGQATSSTEWGTSRRHAGELLMDALNASLPQIYDVFDEDGVKKSGSSTPPTPKPPKTSSRKSRRRSRPGSGRTSNAPTGWRGFTTTSSTISSPAISTGRI